MSENIAIITSGGESSGMNPSIKRFVELSIKKSLNPYLIYDGLEGLIDNKIKPTNICEVDKILNRGGTMIGTSRSKRFLDKKYRKKSYDNLKKHNIYKILVLGGNGTSKAFEVFTLEYNDISFCLIPATIDNDVNGSDYSLGCDTALNIIKSNMLNIKDSASSIKRAYVIETMGRDCSYLAAVSALSSGCDLCFINEVVPEFKSLKIRLLKTIKDKKYLLAIVSEGSKFTSNQVVEWIQNELDIDTRLSVLGYTQRGGVPSAYDSLMAYTMTTKAIERLCEDGIRRDIITIRSAKVYYDDIAITSKKKNLKNNLLDLAKELNRG